MKLFTSKGFYWALISTFIVLWLAVASVSTLHAIAFFQLTNTLVLAILLGAAYEIGQASVLFSILLTKNKDKFLPWALMILLTALQVTANVYASFKFMATSGSNDWTYWQKSILIGVQAQNTEMYQVMISWIAGALLPIVALGMTALVAQNIKIMQEEENTTSPIIDSNIQKDTNYNDTILQNKTDKIENIEKAIDYIKDNFIAHKEKIPESSIDKIQNILEKEEQDSLDQEAEYTASLLENNIESPNLLSESSIEPEKIISQPPKIKGSVRSRKDKNEIQSNIKKEQELLPVEDGKVPQKSKRIVNPLNIKSKIKPIKSLDELIKPSKGQEVIELIEKELKTEVKETIIQPNEINDVTSVSSPIQKEPEKLTVYINGGVEVIEAKAVPNPEVKKN